MTTVQQSSLTAAAMNDHGRSLWHSPVPYLFGGFAAMMALIVFALFILACSYWKRSRNADPDLEAGDIKPDTNNTPIAFEDKYLVIMAGEEKPTFLATPTSSRTSSFGSNSCRCSSTTNSADEEEDERCDQVQVSTMESHVSADQVS